MPAEARVREGDILAGKYRVERVIGSGGMGVVVAARHLQLDVVVALKFMTDEAFADPHLVTRFLREARAAARLRSEHVARVADVGTLESGAPYLVMEYLDGRDLAAVLSREGRQPIANAAEYVAQACEALEEAHRAGVVHRDVKPSNLFLTQRVDGSECIKVLDFGISKYDRLGNSSAKLHATHSHAVLGSPFYMSPEQMRAAHDVDARADIWALGATLYELLTGRVPFEAASLLDLALQIAQGKPRPLRKVRPEIPRALEQVVVRCLEKDREQRYASASELASALRPFTARGESSPAESVGVTETGAGAAPSARKHPALPPDESTLASESHANVSAYETTAPNPAVASGPPPPGDHGLARGWRTGGRLSWGRSQHRLGRDARVLWGLAIAVVAIAGSAGFLALRRASSGARRVVEAASVAAVVPAREQSAATGAAAATPAAAPSTRIPELSVTDLPVAKPAGIAPIPPAVAGARAAGTSAPSAAVSPSSRAPTGASQSLVSARRDPVEQPAERGAPADSNSSPATRATPSQSPVPKAQSTHNALDLPLQ